MNNYIITGDFNCHSDHDKQEPSAKIFLNIIEANNLFDVEKTCNIIFSHGKSNSRGVAILTSFKSGFDIVTHQRDNKGRWVKAEIQMKEKNITVVSVYAPNILTERKIFFKDFEF